MSDEEVERGIDEWDVSPASSPSCRTCSGIQWDTVSPERRLFIHWAWPAPCLRLILSWMLFFRKLSPKVSSVISNEMASGRSR